MESGVELLRLYQRRSASGKTYFIGRLGNARIAVLKDNDAPVDDTTLGVWKVMVQQRDPDRANNRDHSPKPAPAKQATPCTPARPKPRPGSERLSPSQAKAVAAINETNPSDLNDEIGFRCSACR